MLTIILMALLAEPTTKPPAKEHSHPPGVNGVDCKQNGPNKWSCIGACWYGRKPDGGTYGKRIDSTGRTEDEARANLYKQCPKP